MTISTDVVKDIPTGALSGLLTTFEAFNALIAKVDDCEGFLIQIEGGLGSTIHVMDAELQSRPSLTL